MGVLLDARIIVGDQGAILMLLGIVPWCMVK